MYSLNASDDVIYLKDIAEEDLPHVLKWYNSVDEFKYATGMDKPTTLHELKEKYAFAALREDEFFSGIYLKRENRLIGVLKGRLYTGQGMVKKVVWINQVAVDPGYRNKGYGKRAVRHMLARLREDQGVEKALLAVAEENIPGLCFWQANGFSTVKRIGNCTGSPGLCRNIIIMCRDF